MFVVIRGGGDLAYGIALRLHNAGFCIAMTEIAAPLAVRRAVCFSQAVYEGRTQVEDVSAVLVKDEAGMRAAWHPAGAGKRQIAIFIDPSAAIVEKFKPAAIVDAIMAKENTGTKITSAPIVIGVGPGFTAGLDCHAVIETKRGHSLGRVIVEGSALPNTGVPGDIAGFTVERLLRSPADGVFEACFSIGDSVKKDDTVALVRFAQSLAFSGETVATAENMFPIIAKIDGILRGILPSGVFVKQGMKAGDVDPRCERAHCFSVSDKALAVGGGVLEALLRFSS